MRVANWKTSLVCSHKALSSTSSAFLLGRPYNDLKGKGMKKKQAKCHCSNHAKVNVCCDLAHNFIYLF